MRIVSGSLRGRYLVEPKSHTAHPMSGKARGALFNTLGDIEGLTVLDAFAGSGALGFEAISRGAAHCTLIESDKSTHTNILENVGMLGLDADRVKVIRANVSGWSDNNSDAKFDIVLCDPPYDKLQLRLIQKLVRHVADNGLYVLSWPGKLKVPEFQGLTLLKIHDYGDAQLVFYRKIS